VAWRPQLRPVGLGKGDKTAWRRAWGGRAATADTHQASRVAGVALAALFAFLAACLGALAVWAGAAESWIIAVAAGVIAAWLASLAWSTVRRMRS
jgi:hypothetical protein